MPVRPSIAHPVARIGAAPNRLVSVLCTCLVVFSACSSPEPDDENLAFVGTSLPVFGLILQELVGEHEHVVSLINDTQSPHAYHPKPSDIQKMSHVRLFVLGAPDLDGWASGLVHSQILYLSDLIPDESWIVNGTTRNPHFWMDPMLVKSLIPYLEDQLCSIQPEDCVRFKNNGQDFELALDALDIEIRSVISDPGTRALFVTQPFLDYFLKRYNIEIAGTLETVPGNEPPPSHVVELLNSEHAQDALGIVAHERLPYSTARVFEQETSLQILLLDPIGKATDRSYYEFMIERARAIQALIELGK